MNEAEVEEEMAEEEYISKGLAEPMWVAKGEFAKVEDEPLVIAGYASVPIVDKQGELIPLEALREALPRFLARPEYANLMYGHTNLQIGTIIPEYVDKSGKVWRTQVDEKGLFIVARLRTDLEAAKPIIKKIREGKLRHFSIAGSSLRSRTQCDISRCWTELSDIELHEVSVVDKPVNPLAGPLMLLKAQSTDLQPLLNKTLVLIKDYVSVVGSVAEKGAGRDLDLLVRAKVDDPYQRFVKTRILKLLPPKLWYDVHFVYGDEVGPTSSFIPLFDLALIPADRAGQLVSMTVEADGSSQGDAEIAVKGSALSARNDIQRGEEGKMSMESEAKPCEQSKPVEKSPAGYTEILEKLESLSSAVKELIALVKDLPEKYPYPKYPEPEMKAIDEIKAEVAKAVSEALEPIRKGLKEQAPTERPEPPKSLREFLAR